MPYIFGALLVANVALFGFLWLNNSGQSDASADKVRSELTKPIQVINSSKDIPPEIGQK